MYGHFGRDCEWNPANLALKEGKGADPKTEDPKKVKDEDPKGKGRKGKGRKGKGKDKGKGKGKWGKGKGGVNQVSDDDGEQWGEEAEVEAYTNEEWEAYGLDECGSVMLQEDEEYFHNFGVNAIFEYSYNFEFASDDIDVSHSEEPKYTNTTAHTPTRSSHSSSRRKSTRL